MQIRKTIVYSSSIVFLLTMLSCILVASPVFAEPVTPNLGLSCDGEEIKVEEDLSQRTLAEFKVRIRSILKVRYNKRCANAVVERLSPKVAISWLDYLNASPVSYEYFATEMNPETNPSTTPFGIFVEGLAYPILYVHQDNKLPILLDYNRVDFSKSDGGNCPFPCTDEEGEKGPSCACSKHRSCQGCGGLCGICWPDEPMTPSRCYTATESDREILLSEIPLGAKFAL